MHYHYKVNQTNLYLFYVSYLSIYHNVYKIESECKHWLDAILGHFCQQDYDMEIIFKKSCKG